MQTFNSFNELAAGQEPLATDMSVFNALDPNMVKYFDNRQEKLDKAIAKTVAALQAVASIGPSVASAGYSNLAESLGEVHQILNTQILAALEEEKEKVKEERQEAEAEAEAESV